MDSSPLGLSIRRTTATEASSLLPLYTVEWVRERDKFAKIYLRRGRVQSGSFTRYMRNFFKLTPYVRNRIRWALSRGSVGSYHNERLMAASIAPLYPRMKELLAQDCMPFETQGKCACGGEARFDEKLALICDDCNTSYGYKIVTDNFMNMSGEEEDSGDDDSYQVTEMEGPDVDQVSELTYDSTNYEQVERLARNLRKELETKEREEVRQLPYIESNSRKMKSEFLDYRIRLLLKDGGIEQAAVKDLLRQMFGTIVTASMIKTAIRRMEQAARLESTSICTPRGKRIFIRLIAKT